MSEACNAAHLAALAAAHEAAYGIAETGETPVTARSVAAREGDRTIGTCGKQRKAKQQQIHTAGAAQRGVVARTAEPASLGGEPLAGPAATFEHLVRSRVLIGCG